jgi:8-oxo-dGTP pyrophosphatase MutT (NUDIX family)
LPSSKATQTLKPDTAKSHQWAPDDAFDLLLRYFVVPTFDLIIHHESSVLLVRRTITPYKDRWALPGLRMFKGESISDSIERVAEAEVGLKIDGAAARFVGQEVGKFVHGNFRQDLSSCYSVKVDTQIEPVLNRLHFSRHMLVESLEELPKSTGGLYLSHLRKFWGEGQNAGR